MPHWVRGMYIGIWAFVYAIQVWSGVIQYNIMHTVTKRCRDQQQQTKLGDIPATVDKGESSRSLSTLGESSSEQGEESALMSIESEGEVRKCKGAKDV